MIKLKDIENLESGAKIQQIELKLLAKDGRDSFKVMLPYDDNHKYSIFLLDHRWSK